jgi:ATP-dependent DNA helicase RecG
MTDAELRELVERLRALPDETPWVEFKRNWHEPQALGEYLSALANSACLENEPRGFLVYGVDNETHDVVGTDLYPEREKKGNQALLLWLASGLEPNVGYEHHATDSDGKRVVLFSVGAALDRPVRFYGSAWVRVDSHKTRLANHPEMERQIWAQRSDWSAQVCASATLDDLNSEAVAKARTEFKNKYPTQAAEVDAWDDVTFLNKARVAIRGAITNAALVLLGRPEAVGLLSPAVARMTWVLKDERNAEQDYEHFDPPFLLSAGDLVAGIRNLTIRTMPSGTLFPVELSQYDPWVLREALHNCIAHQDYTRGARINVVEYPDRLLLTNLGSFLPGSVERVVMDDAPMEVYRNPYLAQAMVNMNMIDTQGGGIKRMFAKQAGRFFPLPDYDLVEPARVALTIRGTILDERYSRLLMERSDLDLLTIMLLDRVQKGVRIERDASMRLRRLGLVEGRYPNLVVSARIAARTGGQAEQIRRRGFDNQYYRDLLLNLIRDHGPVGPDVIDELLMSKLPDALSEKQKRVKIRNLTYDLAHRRRLIVNVGKPRGSGALWTLREESHKLRPAGMSEQSERGSDQEWLERRSG